MNWRRGVVPATKNQLLCRCVFAAARSNAEEAIIKGETNIKRKNRVKHAAMRERQRAKMENPMGKFRPIPILIRLKASRCVTASVFVNAPRRRWRMRRDYSCERARAHTAEKVYFPYFDEKNTQSRARHNPLLLRLLLLSASKRKCYKIEME